MIKILPNTLIGKTRYKARLRLYDAPALRGLFGDPYYQRRLELREMVLDLVKHPIRDEGSTIYFTNKQDARLVETMLLLS
jgi:hypothetical protein